MPQKYAIRYNDEHSIEMSKPNSSILVYKIPYKIMKQKTLEVQITNRFIVYILLGKNNTGQDIVYVGKSKNGIDNRPTSHEGENKQWHECYILTTFSEKSFFNDGTIQYIENQIHQRIRRLNKFENTTKATNTDTISLSDAEDCIDYLNEVYNMLYILGLNLLPIDNGTEKETKTSIPTNDLQQALVDALHL
jgi:hypothetical protein